MIKPSDRVYRLAARGRQSWPLIQNQSAPSTQFKLGYLTNDSKRD